MSKPQNSNTPVRRMVAMLVIFSLLAVFLSLYFFGYVPSQRADYNRRAFLELEQVKKAFGDREQAIELVISSYLNADTSYVGGSLETIFPHPQWQIDPKDIPALKRKARGAISPLYLQHDIQPDPSGKWSLQYTAAFNISKEPQSTDYESVAVLSKNIDSILPPLTATYNDIFDSYLLIMDKNTGSAPRDDPGKNDSHQGEVIFNSGQLSLDYLVNTDTLLKKTDGFSMLNIHDVKIEGADYKLFLYPFKYYDKRLIIGGLVSTSRYTKAYESIPIGFLTTGGILLLLLLLAIPLCKIFIIGAHERITSLDLRLIIGTYFLGAFLLFILFSRSFLTTTGSIQSQAHLDAIANQLQDSFYCEIDQACRQLKRYDSLYDTLRLTDHGKKTALSKIVGLANYHRETDSQDNALHPDYLQMDNVYWIDKDGKWVGRWGFKHFPNLPLLCVSDRAYFQDIRDSNDLVLDGPFGKDRFALQPTLGKLDGEYVVNIAIRAGAASTKRANDKQAIVLGLTARMYSVCDPVLPVGYGFSIIDRNGDIFFDSKPGRSLLSNLYTDMPDQGSIQSSVAYRQERFFPTKIMRGKETALLIKPLKGMPYSLVVYYDLSAENEFQLHVLALSCFFMGVIILFLILSALFNEWAKWGASLSAIPLVNFEWLRPIPAKIPYYQLLTRAIGALLVCYAGIWALVEIAEPRHEFSLLIISILLPFHAAIMYFLVREKYNKPDVPFLDRIPYPAVLIPALSTLLILLYSFLSRLNDANKFLVGFAELLFSLTIYVIMRRSGAVIEKQEPNSNPDKMIRLYVQAILVGILATTMIPAMGIFGFLYKEELKITLKQDKLSTARAIDERRLAILQRIPNYDFRDSPKDIRFIHDLKFVKGIYLPDRTNASSPRDMDQAISAHPPGIYYDLRNLLFSGDTTILTQGRNADMAGDYTWFFHRNGMAGNDSEQLVFKNPIHNRYEDSIRLPVAHISRLTAIGLIGNRIGSLSAIQTILFLLLCGFLLLVFYELTAALARRIFLLDLFRNYTIVKKEVEDASIGGIDLEIPPDLRKTMSAQGFTHFTPATIREYECMGMPASSSPGSLCGPLSVMDDIQQRRILDVQAQMKLGYGLIWNKLSDREKFVLYDFAVDGLPNYRSGMPLYSLIKQGALYLGSSDRQLHLMNYSFHYFVLDQSDSEVIVSLIKKSREQGAWRNLKAPLFLLLAAAGLFVFLTQDAMYQKITGLFASVGSLVPFISRFFEKANK